MTSRFEGLDDKVGVEIYLFTSLDEATDHVAFEASASISEAIARVRFHKHKIASAGSVIFIESHGFIDEDEFDELLAAVRNSPLSRARAAQNSVKLLI